MNNCDDAGTADIDPLDLPADSFAELVLGARTHCADTAIDHWINRWLDATNSDDIISAREQLAHAAGLLPSNPGHRRATGTGALPTGGAHVHRTERPSPAKQEQLRQANDT